MSLLMNHEREYIQARIGKKFANGLTGHIRVGGPPVASMVQESFLWSDRSNAVDHKEKMNPTRDQMLTELQVQA